MVSRRAVATAQRNPLPWLAAVAALNEADGPQLKRAERHLGNKQQHSSVNPTAPLPVACVSRVCVFIPPRLTHYAESHSADSFSSARAR